MTENNTSLELTLTWCVNAKNSLQNISGFSLYQLAFGNTPQQRPNLEYWPKRVLFLKKKGTKKFTTTFQTRFFSILHQNKVLHNFQKRGKHMKAGENVYSKSK